MTPEMAEYCRTMLLVGFRDPFDAAFDQALELEEPLSDLVLSLSTCVSDDNQVLSILREYTLQHPFDEQVVYQLVIEDIRKRFEVGNMTRSDVCLLLQLVIAQRETFFVEPWHSFTPIFYDLEMWEDGILTEEVFNQCFDAWWYHGEQLNGWELQRQQNVKPKKRGIFGFLKK